MAQRPARRTALRRLTLDDAAEFLAAVEASRDLHAPWIQPPTTSDELATYLAGVHAGERSSYAIVEQRSGALAGYATLSQIVRGAFRSAYLGFAAFAGAAGRGLLTEGLRSVLDEAFGTLELHRVEANVQPANQRSAELVRRLGMRLEGHSPRYLLVDGAWRDHDRYAITAEEWRPA